MWLIIEIKTADKNPHLCSCVRAMCCPEKLLHFLQTFDSAEDAELFADVMM